MAETNPPPELEAWLAAYTTAAADLAAGTVAALQSLYLELSDPDGWSNPGRTLAVARDATGVEQASRAAQATLAADFMLTAVGLLTGAPVAGDALAGVDYPRNAQPFDVYSRPVFTYRQTLAETADAAAAEVAAMLRAETISLTDSTMTRRDAALAQIAKQPVTGFRRVIRPELSATGTCGLCIAAAGRVYTRGDLMPIHSRCRCEVMPVAGGLDPAATYNDADLRRLYAETGETLRSRLTRYRVSTDTELGPVLEPLPAAA